MYTYLEIDDDIVNKHINEIVPVCQSTFYEKISKCKLIDNECYIVFE